MKLKPKEIELRGSWELVGNSIKADNISVRIENLTSCYLIEISEDESGWKKLYQDPEDKRYWELSYPESEIHGGGAPVLKNLSILEVKEKYQV
ncbi:MAG: hypothetical protein IPK11_01125 [Ignavibacteria bacterium]|nr:hypothetical protein [Ignavibacteria bacterium]